MVLPAQKRVRKFDGKRGEKIVSLSREFRVGLDMQFHIQVSCSAALNCFAAAGHAYHLAVFDTRGYDDVNFLFALAYALAAAGLADRLGYLAPPVAARAWPCRGECAEERIARFVHLAFSVAAGARDELGALLCARTVAGITYAGLGEQYTALGSEYRFTKGELNIYRNVASATRPSLSSTKHVAEYVAEVEFDAALSSETLEIGKIKAAEPSLLRSSATGERLAICVVLRALLFVGKYRVSLAHLFEFLLITAFFVGMILVRELSESGFYFFLTRSFGNT